LRTFAQTCWGKRTVADASEARPIAAEVALSDAILEAARSAGMAARAIEGLQRLSGGASKDMWAFTLLLRGDERRDLVLRRQPPGRRMSSQGLDTVAREAALIRLAERVGVPVPAVAFELTEGSLAGDGYAMERLAGETVGVRVLKLPELATARTGMARQCGEILARLHGASGYEDLGLRTQGAHDELAALEARYRDSGQDRPVFEYALRWLGENLPQEQGRVLLHGDFRNGNLMVGPDGIRAVLDWELAHIGPAIYDLAWLCVPSWRFQNPALPVGGFGTREDLITGYESAGGAKVDRAELHAWEVFQTMNWGVMCLGVAKGFVEGPRSVEAGVIARRASETEFDLMRMLSPEHEAWNVR
jgi:aminoglycoside phosphotransferase (APT) family kinase protein